MADIVDFANDIQQTNTDEFINNLKKNAGTKPGERFQVKLVNPTQTCFQCKAPTKTDMHRWCSIKCRDVWAIENE